MASAFMPAIVRCLGAMIPMTATLSYWPMLMSQRAAFLSDLQRRGYLAREDPLCLPTRYAIFSGHTCSGCAPAYAVAEVDNAAADVTVLSALLAWRCWRWW